MSRFKALVTDVEKQIQDTSQTTQVERWINQAQDEIQTFFDWPYLMTRAWLQTVAEYTTGTGAVTVSNGANTISAIGSTWTAAMTGRKIKIASDNQWYIFTFLTTITGTLDRLYEGADATTAAYVMYQDTYRVAGDVNRLQKFRNLNQSHVLEWVSVYDLDIVSPTDRDPSEPRVIAIIGRDNSTYTTGTVSGTAGLRVITGGSSPAWTSVEGLTKGIKINVGNYTYTIKSVDSITQITTYELLVETFATSAYTINLNNIRVKLANPPDSATGIPYRYFRIMPPLVNDGDESEVPEKYHRLLVEGALKRAFMYQFDERKYALAKGEFNEGLLLMQRDSRLTANLKNVLRSDDETLVQNAYTWNLET